MLSTRDTLYIQRYKQIKSERMEKNICAKSKPRRVEQQLLLQLGLKTNIYLKTKNGYQRPRKTFSMIRGSIPQKDITIDVSKYRKKFSNLTKKNPQKTQISKIWYERKDIIADFIDIKKIIREYYEQLNANKLETWIK